MIKTDGKEIYISCGESCYCITVDDRAHKAYFGKRIEPEDKLRELFDWQEPEFFIADGDGNDISDFTFSSAETTEKSKCSFPTLRGDKTVKLSLEDKKLNVSAELYYTPYTRGGIARRCVVTNTGDKKFSVRVPIAALNLSGEYRVTECVKSGVNYIELDGASDAYGVLALYGGKCDIAYSCDGGVTKVTVAVDKTFTLLPGEKIESPEILIVRSEYGADGVMRAVHDILRAEAIPERFAVNRRRVIVSSDSAEEGFVDLTAELGADALLIPVSSITSKLTALSERCKKHGVFLGARVDISDIDLSSGDGADEASVRIHKAIDSLGAAFISLNVGNRRGYGSMLGMYSLIDKITKDYPEIIIDGTGDVALLCYTPIFGTVDVESAFIKSGAVYRAVPPSAIACKVSGESSLKTEFDLCSFGALRYAPSVDKSQGARLAVRAQVFSYQDDSPLAVGGDFYRPAVFGGDFALSIVSKDKSKAYAVYRKGSGSRLRFTGLDNHNLYHVREMDAVFSGAALMGVGVPIPPSLKQGDTLSFHLRQVADYES
ncbi:MAG: GH36 C-terminal domain-containing protein [Clostridiales bacterium]|nr:GH36 C-terminal domain-containing protein [Clostridiales bacterium]